MQAGGAQARHSLLGQSEDYPQTVEKVSKPLVDSGEAVLGKGEVSQLLIGFWLGHEVLRPGNPMSLLSERARSSWSIPTQAEEDCLARAPA